MPMARAQPTTGHAGQYRTPGDTFCQSLSLPQYWMAWSSINHILPQQHNIISSITSPAQLPRLMMPCGGAVHVARSARSRHLPTAFFQCLKRRAATSLLTSGVKVAASCGGCSATKLMSQKPTVRPAASAAPRAVVSWKWGRWTGT